MERNNLEEWEISSTFVSAFRKKGKKSERSLINFHRNVVRMRQKFHQGKERQFNKSDE